MYVSLWLRVREKEKEIVHYGSFGECVNAVLFVQLGERGALHCVGGARG